MERRAGPSSLDRRSYDRPFWGPGCGPAGGLFAHRGYVLADVGVYQGRCYSIARDGHPLRSREEPPVVVGVSLEHGPGRSHQFVRERDDDDVGMSPRLEIREPPSQPVRLLPMMTADGARRPMNEEALEIGVPALADAPKDGLASRGVLPLTATLTIPEGNGLSLTSACRPRQLKSRIADNIHCRSIIVVDGLTIRAPRPRPVSLVSASLRQAPRGPIGG
jgi:hypothetical protein